MNTLPHGKIEDALDAWDPDGPLGNEERFVAAVSEKDNVSQAVDEALGLQPISIRLQRSLLDNLKALAQLNGLGYQPLIRQVLTRFVECEMKSILKDKVKRDAAERALAEKAFEQQEPPHRRAA